MVKKREKNSFLTPLVVEVMPSGKRFRLHYPFTYRWVYGDSSLVFHLPAGLETDFASIPRILRIIIPKLGRWNKASVIHDYLYQGGVIKSRRFADRIFLDAMRDSGVVKWKRVLMYYSVRIFGSLAWRKG